MTAIKIPPPPPHRKKSSGWPLLAEKRTDPSSRLPHDMSNDTPNFKHAIVCAIDVRARVFYSLFDDKAERRHSHHDIFPSSRIEGCRREATDLREQGAKTRVRLSCIRLDLVQGRDPQKEHALLHDGGHTLADDQALVLERVAHHMALPVELVELLGRVVEELANVVRQQSVCHRLDFFLQQKARSTAGRQTASHVKAIDWQSGEKESDKKKALCTARASEPQPRRPPGAVTCMQCLEVAIPTCTAYRQFCAQYRELEDVHAQGILLGVSHRGKHGRQVSLRAFPQINEQQTSACVPDRRVTQGQGGGGEPDDDGWART